MPALKLQRKRSSYVTFSLTWGFLAHCNSSTTMPIKVQLNNLSTVIPTSWRAFSLSATAIPHSSLHYVPSLFQQADIQTKCCPARCTGFFVAILRLSLPKKLNHPGFFRGNHQVLYLFSQLSKMLNISGCVCVCVCACVCGGVLFFIFIFGLAYNLKINKQ